MKLIQIVFISLLMILITISFLNSPGTGDMDLWKQWANNANTLGLVTGYASIKGDYPPLPTLILLSAFAVRSYLGIKLFYAIKLSIILFLFLTVFLFWLWTRDIVTTALLHLALLLNTAALGYIDIYFAPTLLLSLWALRGGGNIICCVLHDCMPDKVATSHSCPVHSSIYVRNQETRGLEQN